MDGSMGAEALWRHSLGWMTRLAWLVLGDADAAEDAVSEAWLRALPRLAGLERPEAYLRTVLVNVCLDQRRRAAMAARHPAATPPAGACDDRYPVEVASVLAALPPQQRAVVVLRHYCDLDDDAIAEAIGVRRATVRSHLRHAHARLREVLP